MRSFVLLSALLLSASAVADEDAQLQGRETSVYLDALSTLWGLRLGIPWATVGVVNEGQDGSGPQGELFAGGGGCFAGACAHLLGVSFGWQFLMQGSEDSGFAFVTPKLQLATTGNLSFAPDGGELALAADFGYRAAVRPFYLAFTGTPSLGFVYSPPGYPGPRLTGPFSFGGGTSVLFGLSFGVRVGWTF